MTLENPDFALIGHPFDVDHLYRYLRYHKPDLRKPRRELLLKLFEWTPPYADQTVEVTSPGGRSVHGHFIVCPLLPEMVNNGNHRHFRDLCVKKVIRALELAAEQGAPMAGLGGFTSIADGDQGRLVARKVPVISVTSGNTLTAMAAVDGAVAAAKLLNVDVARATATVVGAAGDIGTACCRYLASRVKRLVLVSRFAFNQKKLADELRRVKHAEIIVETDNARAVGQADMVIAAASSVAPIFHPRDFKTGAVVCDVGYPKNIFLDLDLKKADIFLFAGGLMQSPSPVVLPYDMGLPDPHAIYGCWSEAIVLALDGRPQSFSLGRGKITPEKMEQIRDIARRHGFARAPFFFGDTVWEAADIERIREKKESSKLKGES
jgi:fatty aldehyde-generating acyl-ACP reductase